MDMEEYYHTFFAEAEELLADMERHLLELDPTCPDKESMNAIFRVAHSIKGGAGTFGFSVLQETTHILENLLDDVRSGHLALKSEIIDLLLQSKDIMQGQLEAYKTSEEPDEGSYRYICEALKKIALEAKVKPDAVSSVTEIVAADTENVRLIITLDNVSGREKESLLEEMRNMGEVCDISHYAESTVVTLSTTTSAEDIQAVLCFILEPEQINIIKDTRAEVGVSTHQEDSKDSLPAINKEINKNKTPTTRAPMSDSSIRVAVEKVDQIINLVGELIITQAMLSQLSDSLEPSQHNDLVSSIDQLERNARDLQESVMSIRMMPMEYVFNRFPRLVHDLAGKLNKKVALTVRGGSAELDKSLIEKIIDPLTHLVRNSLDHGIEPEDVRLAKGKMATGNLLLSAEHHGGNIIIEVIDDGAGLNRERILAQAESKGLIKGDNLTDEEVWMLIFAPGFSTAEKVTDVSGRGVGMDVVRRNIQEMGGHVEIHSMKDKGSTIRIILPLTMAILDGMSVRVGDEIYVLPLGTVIESLIPSEKTLYWMAGNDVMLQVRGDYIPLIELHRFFNIPGECKSPTDGVAVIVQSGGSRYALLVDQLINQHQVVVKNIENNYRRIPGISAATILGDGSVALILDVAVLLKLARK
jgi:two-component system chemotaxis sensor kinase CheA